MDTVVVNLPKTKTRLKMDILFAYVNHARISYSNQPVLSNEGKDSCSWKQQELLIMFEPMTDR